jgi:hypothetical protein
MAAETISVIYASYATVAIVKFTLGSRTLNTGRGRKEEACLSLSVT